MGWEARHFTGTSLPDGKRHCICVYIYRHKDSVCQERRW